MQTVFFAILQKNTENLSDGPFAWDDFCNLICNNHETNFCNLTFCNRLALILFNSNFPAFLNKFVLDIHTNHRIRVKTFNSFINLKLKIYHRNSALHYPTVGCDNLAVVASKLRLQIIRVPIPLNCWKATNSLIQLKHDETG